MIDPRVQVERALVLSVRAHEGQRDKANDPHVLHLMRVWEQVRNQGYGHHYQCAALLQDILSDTGEPETSLLALGIDRTAIRAVHHLTKSRRENYWDYLELCCSDKVACLVKSYDNRLKTNRLDRIEDRVVRERLRRKLSAARTRIDHWARQHGHH